MKREVKEVRLSEYSSTVAYGTHEAVAYENRTTKVEDESIKPIEIDTGIRRFYRKYPNWPQQRTEKNGRTD